MEEWEYDELKEVLGKDAKEVTLLFGDEGSIQFLEALNKARLLRVKGQIIMVVGAKYDKRHDEVTYLLDYSK